MKIYTKTISKLWKELPQNVLSDICLVRSVNLYLQGVDVKPKKDLDIATNYKNVILLSKFFEKDITRVCLKGGGNDFLPFAHLFIKYENFEVEFFDAKDYGKSYYFGVTNKKNIKNLKIDDIVIPVLSLDK